MGGVCSNGDTVDQHELRKTDVMDQVKQASEPTKKFQSHIKTFTKHEKEDVLREALQRQITTFTKICIEKLKIELPPSEQLYIACRARSSANLKLLLAKYDVNSRVKEMTDMKDMALIGGSVLHLLVFDNDLETAQWLYDITKEANSALDIDKTTDSGSSPLHIAACNDRLQFVQWLLSLNADRSLKDEAGARPSEVVVGGMHHEEIKGMLQLNSRVKDEVCTKG